MEKVTYSVYIETTDEIPVTVTAPPREAPAK